MRAFHEIRTYEDEFMVWHSSYRMALEDEKEAGIPEVGIPGRDGETV